MTEKETVKEVVHYTESETGSALKVKIFSDNSSLISVENGSDVQLEANQLVHLGRKLIELGTKMVDEK